MAKGRRVRLHAGGIDPGLVRLRQGGASERATAPGKDIRDIGPDPGPRLCVDCLKRACDPRRRRCAVCIAAVAQQERDLALVKALAAELRAHGLPALGVVVPSRSPFAKKRRQAEAALLRLKKSGVSMSVAGADRSNRPDAPSKSAVTRAPAEARQRAGQPTQNQTRSAKSATAESTTTRITYCKRCLVG